MRTFELFIQNDRVASLDWQRLIKNITEYDKNIAIEIIFYLNTVEFYLYTKKDLSILATKDFRIFLRKYF